MTLSPAVVPTPIVPAPIAPAFRVAPVAPIAPAPFVPARAAKAFPAPAVVPVRAAPAAIPAPVVPAPEPVVVARAQPASNSYVPPPAARVALPAVPAPVVAPPVVAARVALPTPVIAPAPIVPAGPRAVPVAFRSSCNIFIFERTGFFTALSLANHDSIKRQTMQYVTRLCRLPMIVTSLNIKRGRDREMHYFMHLSRVTNVLLLQRHVALLLLKKEISHCDTYF